MKFNKLIITEVKPYLLCKYFLSAGLLSTAVASGGISCLKEDQIRLFENDFFFFFSEWSLYYTMLSIYFERLLDCAGLAFQKPIFFLFG